LKAGLRADDATKKAFMDVLNYINVEAADKNKDLSVKVAYLQQQIQESKTTGDLNKIKNELIKLCNEI
jgi:hypothetical protein